MSELNADEQLKIVIGVWLCLADQKFHPLESAAIYDALKEDLLPEAKADAIKAIGQWVMQFKENNLAAEKKMTDMIASNGRLPLLKNQVMTMAQHVINADNETNFYENNAIKKLESWFS